MKRRKTVYRGFINKMSALLITFVIILQTVLQAFSASYILSYNSVSGFDFTDNTLLAKRLDEVFAGDIDLFSDSKCKTEVFFPLGSRLNNSSTYYVKGNRSSTLWSGKQCYIYANAVYNKLYGDSPGHGDRLSYYRRVVDGGAASVSYKLFSKVGVMCGAYMRTTASSDGSYSSNYGHSLLILKYSKTDITYLEGNGDGNGLVRIGTRTWDEFNNAFLINKNRRVSHIIQPTAEYYSSVFGEYENGEAPADIPAYHVHSYTPEVLIEAGCENIGLTVFTCTCGENYAETQLITGHTDDDGDGICEVCKKTADNREYFISRCSCACHSSIPTKRFVFKLKCLIWQLFGVNEYCDCGERHYAGRIYINKLI